MNTQLADKYDKLKSLLIEYKRVAVGFSGGVDSTFLLKTCLDTLGKENTIAVTADSLMFSASERDESAAFCKSIGAVRHLATIHWVDMHSFVHNPPNRCYLCKKVIFGKVIRVAQTAGIQTVLDGTNADDCLDYRPGEKALSELGIKSPLRDAGLTKDDIRTLSSLQHLMTWNKPAMACLASRIPYGEEITPQKLARIDKSEAGLLALGFTQVRIRCHGDVGRIEVLPEEREKFFNTDMMDHAAAVLLDAGFRFASLDLCGYKMGNLNPVK